VCGVVPPEAGITTGVPGSSRDAHKKQIRHSDYGAGEILALSETGSALSFALKLKNKKRGMSQTQTPKKVAMSMKVSIWASLAARGRQSALPKLRTDCRAL
jgi:hypothetical protein